MKSARDSPFLGVGRGIPHRKVSTAICVVPWLDQLEYKVGHQHIKEAGQNPPDANVFYVSVVHCSSCIARSASLFSILVFTATIAPYSVSDSTLWGQTCLPSLPSSTQLSVSTSTALSHLRTAFRSSGRFRTIVFMSPPYTGRRLAIFCSRVVSATAVQLQVLGSTSNTRYRVSITL